MGSTMSELIHRTLQGLKLQIRTISLIHNQFFTECQVPVISWTSLHVYCYQQTLHYHISPGNAVIPHYNLQTIYEWIFLKHRLDQSIQQVGSHYTYNPPEFLTWASVVRSSSPSDSSWWPFRDTLPLDTASFSSLSPARYEIPKKVSLDHVNSNPLLSLLNWLWST